MWAELTIPLGQTLSDPSESFFTTQESKASTLDRFENYLHDLAVSLARLILFPPFNPGPNTILKKKNVFKIRTLKKHLIIRGFKSTAVVRFVMP